jgi:hypothetical protein
MIVALSSVVETLVLDARHPGSERFEQACAAMGAVTPSSTRRRHRVC